MKNKKYLKVLYDDKIVGTLAYTKDMLVAFQYDDDFVKHGFSISPFILPLKKELYINTKRPTLPYGVFLDTLPDAWGELLLSKKLKEENVDISELNALDKLSICSYKRKGHLYYEPSENYIKELSKNIDLDKIQEFSKDLINAKDISKYKLLDKVYRLNGSTGGARPKINMNIDGDEYIVKFAAHIDPKDIGYIEYKYNEVARECGINVPDYKLLYSKDCKGYFASKRFDDIYTVTIAGLLDIDPNVPSLDYNDIFKIVSILTNSRKEELVELFRRMCFNVYFKNLDDHAKNFSMQYDDEKHIWHMSPAYDLTNTKTTFGEHTTTVNGKGKNIKDEDLLQVGEKAGLEKQEMEDIINLIKKMN